MTEKHIGKVVQVTGPVLDIRFREGELPALLNAIEIDVNGQNYDALFVNNAIDKADMLVIMDMDTSATLIMYAAYSKSKSRSLVEEDIMINQFKQMFKGF